ncbi:protein-disulfide reductase DsbD [Acidithiobacillus sp.]
MAHGWQRAWAFFPLLLWCMLFLGGSVPASAAQFLQPDEAFQFSAQAGANHTLLLRWRVAPGYHLYRDRIRLSVSPSTVILGAYTLPPGMELDDPTFGKVRVLEGTQTLTVPYRVDGTPPAAIAVTSTFQGCADAGVCYPEQRKTVTIPLGTSSAVAASGSAAPAPGGAGEVAVAQTPQGSSSAGVLAMGLQDRFWLTLGLFFVSGLGLAFTPCVFPMIPILSALIVGQESGQGSSRRRAFALSLAYVLGMSLTYTVAGVIAGLTGAYLQAAFQNPWVLGAFAAIFVLLALSMFGFYDLQMPSSIQSRLSRAGKGGHLFSSFVMGVLSALIVGPCVAAPLAGGLLFISQTGSVFLGGLSLFILSLGMGLPLLIIGTSAGHFMPKAGAWMNGVKAIFGVLMLGVAIWLLARVLPGPVTLALWAALAVVSAVYLGAVDALPPSASGWRRFWKGVGILSLGWGLIMGLGALAGGSRPLAPLEPLVFKGTAVAGTAETLHFATVRTPAQLTEALTAAKGKRVLVDFWATWCVECTRMDQVTFANPQVQEGLRGVTLIRVDVSQDDADSRALLKRFHLVGPPAFLLVAADGKTLVQQEGYLGPDAFLRWLKQN